MGCRLRGLPCLSFGRVRLAIGALALLLSALQLRPLLVVLCREQLLLGCWICWLWCIILIVLGLCFLHRGSHVADEVLSALRQSGCNLAVSLSRTNRCEMGPM